MVESNGINLILPKIGAVSWKAAARVVMKRVCRVEEPSEAQVEETAQTLVRQNEEHLKQLGSYSYDLSTPQGVDTRAFSAFRPGYQIYVEFPICSEPLVKEEPPPLAPVPLVPLEPVEPEAAPEPALEPLPPEPKRVPRSKRSDKARKKHEKKPKVKRPPRPEKPPKEEETGGFVLP